MIFLEVQGIVSATDFLSFSFHGFHILRPKYRAAEYKIQNKYVT